MAYYEDPRRRDQYGQQPQAPAPPRPPMPGTAPGRTPAPAPGQTAAVAGAPPVAPPAGQGAPPAPSSAVPNTQGTYQAGRDPGLDAKIADWQQNIDSRYDAGAWAAWAPFQNPNCPKNRPFSPDPAHMKGMGVTMSPDQAKSYCVEKPVDVPDELRGQAGGGAGAGAGGGPGGGKGGGMPGGLAGMAEGGEIWKSILGRLKGGSRFTPEVMDTLLGSIKSQGEGAAERASEEAEADFARRGLSRSSLAGRAQQEIRTGLAGDILQSQAALKKAKVDADFADKTQAINDGLNWLNSLRTHVAQMKATSAQKEVAMANIKLGYQQLQHATNTMRERYQQELSVLGYQL